LAPITTEQGTDYKSAPAESDKHLCELSEAKSAPAYYSPI